MYRSKREIAESLLCGSTKACKAVEEFALAVLEDDSYHCDGYKSAIDKLIQTLRGEALSMYCASPAKPEDNYSREKGKNYG